MLKLRRPKLLIETPTVISNEAVGEKKKRSNRKMMPDVYNKEEFDPVQIIVDENLKLNFSVRRGGDMGLPRIDIRHYMTTPVYEGFTQNGINVPIEIIPHLVETLSWVDKMCKIKGLYYFENDETQ